MIKRISTGVVALVAMVSMAACDDTPTDPRLDGDDSATVESRVDQTTPASSSGSSPQPASGSQAQSVSVVQITASGEYRELASAEVEADGSYRIEGVPSGRSNTAVVAYVDGRAAGEVLIHGEIRSRAVVRPAPITYETTMEARAYARIVASGRADQTSTSEVALLLHANDSELESTLSSDAELQAVAEGSAEASAATTGIFADAGLQLDADTRSQLLLDAALSFTTDLVAGLSVNLAHQEYVDAAIDAYAGAGAELETIVVATAGAASTFDAQVEGRTSTRGRLIAHPVLMNLRARQRTAARFETSAEGSLAVAVTAALAETRTRIEAATTAADIRAELDARLDATVDAAADAAVELLAADASTTVRSEVRAAAETALAEATLRTRFQGTATASAATSAVVDYRASVRSAVQAMVDASGSASTDVEAITEIFIAACGGAYIR